MALFGWMSDFHFRPDSDDTKSGPVTEFQTDYNKLVDTYAVDDMFIAGDVVHPETRNQRPHVPPRAYTRFWDDIVGGTTDGGDAIRATVPGNHDIPIQEFVKSDKSVTLRQRIDYDAAGVTVLMLNTHAPGMVTGDQGTSIAVPVGSGQVVPRISYRDLLWLDEQLADAGSNAKLLIPHAHLYPGLGRTTSLFGGNMATDSTYWVIRNWERCHNILKQYNKVVVAQGHGYWFGSGREDNLIKDGVHYVGTQHYADDSSDPVTVTTFSRIDIDSAGCTITSEEHSDGTEYTNLSVTF